MSAATGVTAHTLRYYERAELVRPVARSSGNQRRYSVADVEWVKFLLRLRETGMPIAQMREYSVLREQGPSTTESRLQLLEMHQAVLHQQVERLRAHEKVLASKIATYRKNLSSLQTPQKNGTNDD